MTQTEDIGNWDVFFSQWRAETEPDQMPRWEHFFSTFSDFMEHEKSLPSEIPFTRPIEDYEAFFKRFKSGLAQYRSSEKAVDL
ncbi:MAG: hypothetical protein WCR47_03955 [Desulfoplanes sp.]